MSRINVLFEKLPEYFQNDTLKLIFDNIEKGESVQFIGLTGMGKSLLLRNLEASQEQFKKTNGFGKDMIISLCDLDLLSDGSTSSTLKHIFGKLVGMDMLSGADSFEVTSRICKYFENLKKEGKMTIIVLDSLEKFEQYHNYEVYKFLNGLYKSNIDNIKFIFSLEREINVEKAMNEYGYFGRLIVGKSVYLRAMDQKESEWFLSSLCKVIPEPKLSKDKKKLILKASGGMMFVIKRLFEAFVSGDNLSEKIDDPSSLVGLAYNFESMLGSQELGKKTLTDLVSDNLTEEDYSKITLYKKCGLLDGDNKFTSIVFENYIKHLVGVGKSNFEDSVGDVKVNAKLTASEFKILDYLYTKKNQICRRDDIINEVWNEKAIGGIADHALDQIISRLRKKLKKSNPEIQIETLRGRGHRLIV